MSLTDCWIFIVGVGLSASCQESSASAPAIEVVFAVESDPGVRLGKVHIAIDGKSVGETDSNGLLRTEVVGEYGKRRRIEHDCPQGHAKPSAEKFLRLRSFDGAGESQLEALKVTLRCQPKKRLAVFIIRAKNGANLAVRLNRQVVAQTNRYGIAQLSTSAPPGTDFIIELDTASRPQLTPQHPTHLRTLPDADEIFVINQSFELRKAPRGRGRPQSRITKIE
ncbi:MAG: hypothetical protein HKN10_16355 [Myxococcales bacterium]|nr:hypothetical protein [Myxococcales bacterium]